MKDKSITFSIITTTYNRASSGYLEQNIRALQKQKPGNYTYEHIIIDDGSTDGTKKLVEDIMQGDPRISYIYQDNDGPVSAARNGMKAAKGEYIILMDDDDYLSSDSLLIRYNYTQKYPDVDFFYGKADWVDDYSLPIQVLYQGRDYGEHLYDQLLIDNCIHGGTTTVRRSNMMSIVWPDWVERSQDYFMWLEIMRPENNAKAKYIDEVLFHYRYHKQGYTAGINSEAKKIEKTKINQRIRDHHKTDKAYLADIARHWLDEAHKANEYRLIQLQDRDTRIEELQEALDYYTRSRVVRHTVKVRNVLRGRVLDRIDHSLARLKKVSKKDILISEQDNKEWPDDKPLVSVITPVYNRKNYIPDTIRSVLDQSFQDFEYIIVDDGSSDPETLAYLDRVVHPKIRVIHKPNGGVASARNAGLAIATGKYVMCLDDDDILEPTFIEKAVLFLEANHDLDIVTYNMQMFGKVNAKFEHDNYDPIGLIGNNMVLTSALARRDVWEAVGGYKDDIGYEDWEFWLSAAEKGYFGFKIPETLFNYRTADISRYVEDLQKHEVNTKVIKKLHPNYLQNVRRAIRSKDKGSIATPKTALINLDNNNQYRRAIDNRQHVLIAVPWLPFGGAEMYTHNFMTQLAGTYRFSIVTGIKDDHIWTEKFNEITPYIYHLATLYQSEAYYYNFIYNYIKTRNVDILHIVHAGYPLRYIEDLKKEFPNLRVVVTLFNDRVPEYVELVRKNQQYIDALTSDNRAALDGVTKGFTHKIPKTIAPNGIDSDGSFNPELHNRQQQRTKLGVDQDDIIVCFVGRLSEEKNPDVFVEVASEYMKKTGNKQVKFLMAGDGIMNEQVVKMIDDRKDAQIEYLGYKTPSDVVALLSASDIFVLPSSIEGFPVALAEAMSMRLIPIASSVGAVPDVIQNGKNGYITKPGDVDQIVDALIKVTNNISGIEKMKDAARMTIKETCTIDNMGKSYKDVYGEVLKT